MAENRRYRSQPENVKLLAAQIVISIVATAVVAYLFYKSIWGLLLAPMIFAVCHILTTAYIIDKKDREFYEEFRQFLELITASMQAGYSIENSVKESAVDMRSLFGERSEMVRILNYFVAKMRLQVPLETLFNEMADRKPYEEVVEFAGMFTFAKRMGGDYVKHINQSALKISEKIRLKQEIDTMIAAKKLELYIMCAMPMGILGFINISSPEFLDGLYHNITGVVIMSLCLAAYAGCVYLGIRIINIEV